MELRLCEYTAVILRIFLSTESEGEILCSAESDVLCREICGFSEEHIVVARTCIVRIAAVRCRIGTCRHTAVSILYIGSTCTCLVHPAVELVEIWPACTGSVSLFSHFLVIVIVINYESLGRSARTRLGNCQILALHSDSELEVNLTVETGILKNRDSDGLSLSRCASRLRRNNHPVSISFHHPVTCCSDSKRLLAACSIKCHFSHTQTDIRSTQILLRFLAGCKYSQRSQGSPK